MVMRTMNQVSHSTHLCVRCDDWPYIPSWLLADSDNSGGSARPHTPE